MGQRPCWPLHPVRTQPLVGEYDGDPAGQEGPQAPNTSRGPTPTGGRGDKCCRPLTLCTQRPSGRGQGPSPKPPGARPWAAVPQCQGLGAAVSSSSRRAKQRFCTAGLVADSSHPPSGRHTPASPRLGRPWPRESRPHRGAAGQLWCQHQCPGCSAASGQRPPGGGWSAPRALSRRRFKDKGHWSVGCLSAPGGGESRGQHWGGGAWRVGGTAGPHAVCWAGALGEGGAAVQGARGYTRGPGAWATIRADLLPAPSPCGRTSPGDFRAKSGQGGGRGRTWSPRRPR